MHTWLFPRFSVIERHNELAFRPYPDKPSWAPDGVFELKYGTVAGVEPDEKKVILHNGESIGFEYLVLATGSAGRYPAGSDGKSKKEIVEMFQKQQKEIRSANRILVVGGGQVGVEVALDIKTEFADKEVLLVHSRDRLAHGYVAAVHDKCMQSCADVGVKVILNERPQVTSSDAKQIKLSTGEILKCDLMIICTGFANQTESIPGLPGRLVKANGLIHVKPTFQLDDADTANIFAIGDVADTGVKKMGRAAGLQGLTVTQNIVRSISGRPMQSYQPGMIESSLDLTLGLTRHLIHIQRKSDVMQFCPHTKDEIVGAIQVWSLMERKPEKEDAIPI